MHSGTYKRGGNKMSKETAIGRRLRIPAILAALFLFAAAFAVFASDDKASEQGLGADNIEYIYTAEDLADLAAFVNGGGVTAGTIYSLENDLDLSVLVPAWVPIGYDQGHSFNGIFEGNGYKITGLVIKNLAYDNVGLFGYVYSGGTIRNLTVEDANVTGKASTNSTTGIIVGFLNNGTITNCHATGNVAGHSRVGGIAGEVFDSTNGVSYSSFKGNVTGTGTGSAFDNIGGIAGYMANSKITQCYAEGTIKGRNSVGGIVGHISASVVASLVSDCYFIGDVKGNDYIGGIVGDMNRSNANVNITVTKCYAVGTVYGNNAVGGIVGYLYNGKITNCVALNETVTAAGVGAGRVVGTINPSAAAGTVLTNNAAFAGMKAGGAAFEEGQDTLSGKDGAGMCPNEINTDGTLGSRFSAPIWIIADGKLPSFKPYAMPLYLLPVELEAWMFAAIDDLVYNGSAQMPGVSAAGDVTFIIIEYLNNIDAGTASIVVKGTGRYIGTVTITFEILPKGLTDGDLGLAAGPYVYNGSAWTPGLVDGLAEKRDYSISYVDNVNAGTATVKIVGKGNYFGTITKTFVIEPKQLTDELYLTGEEYVYNGLPWRPGAVDVLMDGIDYTMTYTDNVNAGTATVKIVGKGNYEGTLTKTFVIDPKPLSVTMFGSIPSEVFADGHEKTPIIVGYGISETIDFTVEYMNNIGVGEATVVIRGIGNYSGEVDLYFMIVPESLTNVFELVPEDFVYNGGPWTPAVITSSDLVEGMDYTVAYVNNTAAGLASVIITGGEYHPGTVTLYFTIAPQTLGESLELEYYTCVYNGKPWTPGIVSDLKVNVDYVITYTNNVNALGGAFATVTGIGNYAGTVNIDFTIEQKPLKDEDLQLAGGPYVYNGSAWLPGIVDGLAEGRDYTITYAKNVNAGNATVTVNGKGNYKGETEKTFVIEKRHLSDELALIPPGPYVYNGNAWMPGVVEGLAEGRDYTITYANNVNAGTASVRIDGIGNYDGEIVMTFVIGAKELSDELQMAGGPFIYNGSAWSPAVVPGLTEGIDYTITYANNVNAGTATVRIEGMGNYYGTLSAEFTISPRPITVTPAPGQTKDYGTDDPIFAYTVYDGLRGMSLNGALSRIAGEKAGTYLITIGTLGHANYDITFVDDVLFEIVGGPEEGTDTGLDIGPVHGEVSLPPAALAAAIAALSIILLFGFALKMRDEEEK